MKKRVLLCGQCRELLKGQKVDLIQTGGRSDKITCDNCGKRRYGTEYEIEVVRTRRAKRDAEADV